MTYCIGCHNSSYAFACIVSTVKVNVYVALSYPSPVEEHVLVVVPLLVVVVQFKSDSINGLNVTDSINELVSSFGSSTSLYS